MTRPVILTEKLRRPEPAGLARQRLETPLLHGSTSRLDLVVAPPGSGKTTLLARVAASATAAGMPVAWYRITGDDTAEAALVAHLGRALGDALGVNTTDTTMGALLESLETWSGSGAILILDDLHEIAGSAAERSLEQFVQLRPHALRMLAGSRRHPEINIPRLRVSGLLQEFSNDDLRFRSWEVEELFISVFHEPLSPESAAALTRRTGGWAAGLQLFHLATSGRTVADRQRAVDDLGGRSKLVRSYLARNVLAELPPGRRDFLLRTCTLGTLTGELCDALLESTGSRRVLDELEQQQLFTSSEDDGETFRYHEVLRTHLEWALVEEYGAAGARQWYSRSAALLESIGDERAAIRAHARAEDWGAVARLIQGRGTGPDVAVAGPDLLLPASIVEHDPWLSLAEARRRVREGALDTAIDAFRRAEQLLDEPEFRERCRRERSVAAMWCARRATGPVWKDDDRGAAWHWSAQIRVATARGAPASPGPLAGGRPADTAGGGGSGALGGDPGVVFASGVVALLAGEFYWARTVLNSVADDSSADATLRLLAQLGSTVIDLVTVGSADPSVRLGQIALDAELAGLPWVARLARGLGEISLVVLGGPSWRMTACVDLLGECDRAGDDWGAALLQLAVAVAGQIAGSTGDPGEFAAAATRFHRLDAPVLALWSDALQACVLARHASPGAAEFAHRVATRARAVQHDGVQAVAIAALTVAAGGDQRPVRVVIGDTAHAAGVRGALLLLTGQGQIVAAQDVSAVSGGTEPRPTHPGTGRGGSATAPGSSDTSTLTTDGGHPADDAAPTVLIRCFGGFGFEVDGASVDLSTLRPRARALLRLLALNPDRDVHREHLVDALWPGADLALGTRRLQVAVSSIRQVLEGVGLNGSSVVARRGDAYRLALPSGGMVDVREFERGLRDAALAATRGDTSASMAAREAALALYRGDALPEDGPAEYVIADRERLRLAAAGAAAALAEDSRRMGTTRQALAAARLSVQLDRFSDLGWELLVELHEQAGDHSAAARARQEHAQAQAELDAAVT